mmetsp:Transcript_15013/g.19848  ORF Transcript_15013/g.19848 Transcript_15013/m.19848 type:complete len:80 (+) Transcript_15013:278-517(+)
MFLFERIIMLLFQILVKYYTKLQTEFQQLLLLILLLLACFAMLLFNADLHLHVLFFVVFYFLQSIFTSFDDLGFVLLYE